jgi:hypothetical protein
MWETGIRRWEAAQCLAALTDGWVLSIAALEGAMEARAAALDGGGDVILAMGVGCWCLLVVTLADQATM